MGAASVGCRTWAKNARKDCCGVCKAAISREIPVHNEDKKRNIIDLRKMEAPVPCKCFF